MFDLAENTESFGQYQLAHDREILAIDCLEDGVASVQLNLMRNRAGQ
jgi:hypothetical protein